MVPGTRRLGLEERKIVESMGASTPRHTNAIVRLTSTAWLETWHRDGRHDDPAAMEAIVPGHG